MIDKRWKQIITLCICPYYNLTHKYEFYVGNKLYNEREKLLSPLNFIGDIEDIIEDDLKIGFYCEY